MFQAWNSQKTQLTATHKPEPIWLKMGLEQENAGLIKVSIGTAAALGLLTTKLDAEPTTAYLMTYRSGKCMANCGFCPQARTSTSKAELLSRITWHTFPTETVTKALASAFKDGKIKRVCIQALNYPQTFIHLQTLIKEIKKQSPIPISVSCQPLNTQNIVSLKAAGADRLGIALDAATEIVFNRVKGGSYNWAHQFNLLEEALAIFGAGNVSTHVIVGLGETEKEAVEIIQKCVALGVLPALFAFTPVRGTALEGKSPPKLESYRRIQLARYLIVHGNAKAKDMSFDEQGNIAGFGLPTQTLKEAISNGAAFRTSGCPDCNRPYYNEKPSGPIYNYPKAPTKQEVERVKDALIGQ